MLYQYCRTSSYVRTRVRATCRREPKPLHRSSPAQMSVKWPLTFAWLVGWHTRVRTHARTRARTHIHYTNTHTHTLVRIRSTDTQVFHMWTSVHKNKRKHLLIPVLILCARACVCIYKLWVYVIILYIRDSVVYVQRVESSFLYRLFICS